MKPSVPQIIEDLQMVRPPDPLPWILGAVAFVLIVALAGLAVWLYQKRKLPGQTIRTPDADEVALRSLARLRELMTSENVRPFVVSLTTVLRFYIESRFRLNAPRLSTEEFLYVAECDSALSTAQREALRAILVLCDRVKFALAGMEHPVMIELYQATEDFIRQTAADKNSQRGNPQ
jgi:di/tricarboxylate transporter